MRLLTITARAFGPYKNETLSFAPGLNVVGGPNESGKSTWNAAIRAALTGVRRGKGRPGVDAQEFADMHRPWDAPDVWEVEARIVLDDGRTIDVIQDLADKVASRAVELPLGRDVSPEIIFEGSPDPSQWLGLDREVFARTVWVGQGEIMALTDRDATDRLQAYLQRAAASRPGDATVAEALDRLDDFRKNAIGSDWATTKPLQKTRTRLQVAQAGLREGRIKHAEYLRLLARANEARAEHEAAALRCRAMRTAVALRDARQLKDKFERAETLAMKYPTRPAGAPDRDELSDRVAAVLQAWKSRPQPITPAGPTAEALRRQIASLPALPSGDQGPAQSVVDAFDALNRARGATSMLGLEPNAGPAPAAAGLTGSELRSLASDLSANVPVGDPKAEERMQSLQIQCERSSRTRNALGAAAVLAVAAGLVGILTQNLILGIAFVLALLFVVIAGLQQRTLITAARELSELGRASAPLADQRRAAQARQTAARDRLAPLGVAAEPTALGRLADAVDRYAMLGREREQWLEREIASRAVVEAAQNRLDAALRERGAGAAGQQTIDDTYQEYLAACRNRAEAATGAQQRGTVEQLLDARQLADASYAAAIEGRDQAERALGSVTAAACPGVPFTSDDERRTALETWQQQRTERVVVDHQTLVDWEELQALLRDQDLPNLRREAEDAAHAAKDLVPELPQAALPSAQSASNAKLTELETAEHERVIEKEKTEAELKALVASMKDIAELEEDVFSLSEERDRLERLAAVVDKTLELLRQAEERVQRGLAPVLAASVQRFLPAITSGRYTEVAVDPATLSVSAKEARTGRWRTADLLSGGTREQIYLLLRIAMAEHLASKQEMAPLFMDEVTAQSDPARARTVIESLQALSQERQVVVFTHDPSIVAWAKATLGSRDQIVELSPTQPPPAPAPEPAPTAEPWWKSHLSQAPR